LSFKYQFSSIKNSELWILLPFHNIYVVHVYSFKIPVSQKHYGQANRSFGCCYGDDKDGEYLSDQSSRGYKFGESYEVDIDRVEHQLDGHQNPDGIPPG
jgi:hypothetical protein